MKKVLSLSLASAMVLTMGTAAFADFSFGSNSSSNADWPNEFGFGGKLVVTYNDEAVTTELGDSNNITIYPGSKIYMPLYHNVEAVVGESTPTIGESGEAVTGFIPYKGKIDKNWRVNFIEKSKRFIETAEFYKANSDDKNLTKDAVYIKVDVVEELDSINEETINFGVFVAEKGSNNRTKQVYVKGDFSNPIAPNKVDFDWANQVNGPMIWEVAKDEDGTAVFNFGDDATYTVKMFGEEKVLLNLSRDHDKKLITKYDTDMEFYNFKGTQDSFTSVGTLSIPVGDEDVYVYENVNGALKPLEFTFNSENEAVELKTRNLGNYVITTSELDIDYSEEVEEETEEDDSDDRFTNTDDNFGGSTGNGSGGSSVKPNPNTGADSMVGAAAAMAVLSLAGGAAMLKKRK